MPIKQPPTMPTEVPDSKKPSEKDKPQRHGDDHAMEDEADIAIRESREKAERAARDRDDPASDVSGPDVDFVPTPEKKTTTSGRKPFDRNFRYADRPT